MSRILFANISRCSLCSSLLRGRDRKTRGLFSRPCLVSCHERERARLSERPEGSAWHHSDLVQSFSASAGKETSTRTAAAAATTVRKTLSLTMRQGAIVASAAEFTGLTPASRPAPPAQTGTFRLHPYNSLLRLETF